ncbi:MAG: hypothetical protein ABFD92_21385 [Planctomycetaceae bacterium]
MAEENVFITLGKKAAVGGAMQFKDQNGWRVLCDMLLWLMRAVAGKAPPVPTRPVRLGLMRFALSTGQLPLYFAALQIEGIGEAHDAGAAARDWLIKPRNQRPRDLR